MRGQVPSKESGSIEATGEERHRGVQWPVVSGGAHAPRGALASGGSTTCGAAVGGCAPATAEPPQNKTAQMATRIIVRIEQV